MSKEDIPARTVLTCDRCGQKGERGKPGSFEYGGFHLEKKAFCEKPGGGDGMAEYDFCSRCVGSFYWWMKKESVELPATKKPTVDYFREGETVARDRDGRIKPST